MNEPCGVCDGARCEACAPTPSRKRMVVPSGCKTCPGCPDCLEIDYSAFTDSELKIAHKFSFKNRKQFEESEIAGCFWCCKIFTAPFIIRKKEARKGKGQFEYTTERDGEQTIICACGVDSVIGSASGITITPEFLKAMHGYWFRISES